MAANRFFPPRPAREPGRYTPELAARICGHLEDGRLLEDICRDDGMPLATTVRRWVQRNYNGFAELYKRARGERGSRSGTLSHYTYSVAERICEELSKGRSLRAICRDAGMPSTGAVRRWVQADHEGFAARYRSAREMGYHKLAEQIVAIADGADTDEERLRAELRVGRGKWLLAIALPKVRHAAPLNVGSISEAEDSLRAAEDDPPLSVTAPRSRD